MGVAEQAILGARLANQCEGISHVTGADLDVSPGGLGKDIPQT
jgi:hypothetical protein